MTPIPFNRPHTTGREFDYIREAIGRAHIAGDGIFSRRCQAWLEEQVGCVSALLTHSCTGALEMAALLERHRARRRSHHAVVHVRVDGERVRAAGRRAGLRRHPARHAEPRRARHRCGADAADTSHRAGALRRRVLRDGRDRRPRRAGTICWSSRMRRRPSGRPTRAGRPERLGDLAATSFHETKNVTSGEGGALLINAPALAERAEVIRDKGTNRGRFLRGEIDKYTWIDVGSSFVPSELTAAFLWAQMEAAGAITERRLEIWNWYYAGVRGARAPGTPAAADRSRTLPPQRPHVLRARPGSRDQDPSARRSERCRCQRRVSLRAAALVGGRPAVRTHRRRSVCRPTASADGSSGFPCGSA